MMRGTLIPSHQGRAANGCIELVFARTDSVDLEYVLGSEKSGKQIRICLFGCIDVFESRGNKADEAMRPASVTGDHRWLPGEAEDIRPPPPATSQSITSTRCAVCCRWH